MLSAKQGNHSGTIVLTSLVWSDPWLGIEPGTSRTRSQYPTPRLYYIVYVFETICYLIRSFLLNMKYTNCKSCLIKSNTHLLIQR